MLLTKFTFFKFMINIEIINHIKPAEDYKVTPRISFNKYMRFISIHNQILTYRQIMSSIYV